MKVIMYTCLFIVLGLASLCRGQQVQGVLDSTTFLIGDQTRLSLRVIFSGEVDDIHFSKTTLDTSKAIEYVNQSSLYKEEIGGVLQYRRDYLIAFFDTGAYYIPSIPIMVKHANRVDTLYTSSIPIRVRAIASDSVYIAPIKPIILEKWRIWDAWPIAIALCVIALIAGLIFYRRKQKKAAEVIIEIPKTPYELAMIGLDALAQEKYIQKGKLKEHYAQLSVVLRSYLENQFSFPASESTTREIGYGLDVAKFPSELKSIILDKLQEIDLIKFAKVQPDMNEIEGSTESMRKQIQAIADEMVKPELSEENDLNRNE